jgi:hypothetical protein
MWRHRWRVPHHPPIAAARPTGIDEIRAVGRGAQVEFLRGLYSDRGRVKTHSTLAQDDPLARDHWQRRMAWVGQT